ncbi:hypothetical protein KC614_01550 [candidate division WWE3 bacterium]|uniref:Uncharacterized protein n=1 Tax=candidate division WWE3 bacterium TaxID=2053526 RepID=A0A955RRT0_UNCKA|nr:hypothetical protein [candidate division WWE3 bacterium]
MKKYINAHILQYFFILLLFALTVTVIEARIDLVYKLIIITITIFVYFFWSVWHHWEDHTLTTSVVLEYLTLTAILLWLLINLAV